MNQAVLVSAIIPAYNTQAHITDAIDSVLAQKHRSLELIVIDDGSTDDTALLVACYKNKVKYFLQPHSGAPVARNLGLSHAKGSVIAFLDADDTWSKDKLSLQLGCLKKHPEVDVILGRRQSVLSMNTSQGHQTVQVIADNQIAMNLGCGLFKKRAFDRVGGFDESLKHTDDWDWYMRAKEQGLVMMTHDDVVQVCRRHDKNMTNDSQQSQHYYLRMLKKSLDRRRSKGDGNRLELPHINELPKYRAKNAL